MANEIKVSYTSGRSLTYYIYYDNNGTLTLREETNPSGVSMTEEPSGRGLYVSTPDVIATGDIIHIQEGSTLIGASEYNPSAILSSDGLDSISITEPSGRASNFREVLIQTWMRFFNKVTKSPTTITVYNEDGTAITTQTYSESTTDTVNKAT